jgi:hypothetical protein
MNKSYAHARDCEQCKYADDESDDKALRTDHAQEQRRCIR